MTMQNPLDFTQGDLAGLMEAGQTIANMPGVGGGSSPLGGVSELLDTVQKGLNMFEQFQQSVDKFGTTIARLRGAEGLGQPAQSGFFPPGQVVEGNVVYRPPDQVTPTPTNPEPTPGPAPAPEPVPTIKPQQIFRKALGWLAQLPEEMTMKEALELARSNKGMILGAIEKELPDLLSADGPGE